MSSAYLLTGESFLAEEALDEIRRSESTDVLSEVTFDPSSEAAELVEALETASLLGDRRLVVIRDAQDLKKDHAEALAGYLESPSPSSVLVMVASGRTKLDAVVRSKGDVIALEAPKGRRLVTWLRDRARARRLKLDERGAWALVDAVGNELRDLDAALEQLATGIGTEATVDAAKVRSMFARLADERIYAFTDAVGDRRLPLATSTLRRLLDQGDEPLVLFGALVAHIRRLLRARRYVDQGARVVGDALGLPTWRAERVQRQARSFTEDELVASMDVLAETDVEMKGDFPSPEGALERAVIRIVTGTFRS
jgi:DNA polymerase III subunit delta